MNEPVKREPQPEDFEQGARRMKPEEIAMLPVESKNLSAYGFDPETKTLVVRFKYQSWKYFVSDFSPEDWADFQAAGSKGKFYHARVRPFYKNVTKG